MGPRNSESCGVGATSVRSKRRELVKWRCLASGSEARSRPFSQDWLHPRPDQLPPPLSPPIRSGNYYPYS